MYIDLKENGYEAVIERGCFEKAENLLNLKRKVLIVTDEGVPSKYSKALANKCDFATILTVPQGEKSKSFVFLEKLCSVMLEKGFHRKDCVVAVGGGVCGDLAGFAASVFMRGIDFYNIPTTLLSQIDSSVGGKTAVNLGTVKNIVGSFYQPKKVLIDPTLLETLDKRQLSNGYAEAIKMGLTSDEKLFNMFYENKIDIIEVITRSLDVKRKIVEQDEKESNLRKVLNFGHTLGHGIEANCDGELYHGECVGIGMRYMCSDSVREKLDVALKNVNLPITSDVEKDLILKAAMHDKKASSGSVDIIYVENPGSFEIRKISEKELKEVLYNEKVK
ncbi:MAG: 3-dehydroquinate synthase [Clostridia bacterium]|nr:3-dehydroquinate synthase [Clostridia bacterium]